MAERILTKEIAATTAFMAGVPDESLDRYFGDECGQLLDRLYEIKEAKIIRTLCIVRTIIMKNFSVIDGQLRYDLKNIDRMPQFPVDDIKWLTHIGVKLLSVNMTASKYLIRTNSLIYDYITQCKSLFPDWLVWDYIKDIFIIPNCNNHNETKAIKASKDETGVYMSYINFYPFQCYIHWQPEDVGFLFINDRKFLEVLYRQHGDQMFDDNMVMDASDNTKFAIYDFIDDNTTIDIIVDCENSDIYKLYSTLSNLDTEKLSKINKIILYDDYHTVGAWRLLQKIIKIPVEYNEVERVTSGKSLVDIKMTAGACKEFYQNNVSAFIIVSSDSDFWGLISSLPDADFLVMIEYEKCGSDIKRALDEHDIFYCAIDDFCKGNIDHIKNLALRTELKRLIDEFNSNGYWQEFDSSVYVDNIYRACRIDPTPSERKKFVDNYIRKLKLGINSEGRFYIYLP